MLFGHQNDSKQPVVNDVTAPDDPSVNPLAVDPDTGISLPVIPEELEHDGGSDQPPVLDQPHDEPATQTFSPSDDASSASNDDSAAPQIPTESAATDYTSEVVSARTDAPQPAGDDLLGLKQQALQQLTPLVGHLDQSPEEKFRTTMMMIQSSDNQSLIKDAYAAAQAITDDKVRAQALLDVVNEINYFTQQQNQ